MTNNCAVFRDPLPQSVWTASPFRWTALAIRSAPARRCRRCIHRKLWRFVHRLIDTLHHRKENFLLRNHLDLYPCLGQDDELRDPTELIPFQGSPCFSVDFQAEQATKKDYQSGFTLFLGKERRLKTLYACHCAGITNPRDLARKLKLNPRTIRNLQKRLRRKHAAFHKLHPQTP